MGTNRHDRQRHLNVRLRRISNPIGVNLARVILLLFGVNVATVITKTAGDIETRFYNAAFIGNGESNSDCLFG